MRAQFGHIRIYGEEVEAKFSSLSARWACPIAHPPIHSPVRRPVQLQNGLERDHCTVSKIFSYSWICATHSWKVLREQRFAMSMILPKIFFHYSSHYFYGSKQETDLMEAKRWVTADELFLAGNDEVSYASGIAVRSQFSHNFAALLQGGKVLMTFDEIQR